MVACECGQPVRWMKLRLKLTYGLILGGTDGMVVKQGIRIKIGIEIDITLQRSGQGRAE